MYPTIIGRRPINLWYTIYLPASGWCYPLPRTWKNTSFKALKGELEPCYEAVSDRIWHLHKIIYRVETFKVHGSTFNVSGSKYLL